MQTKLNNIKILYIFLFWLGVVFFLSGLTYGWHHWVQQPLFKSKQAINADIIALNKQVEESKNSGQITPGQKLRQENLMDLNTVSGALHKASQQGSRFVLLSINQGSITPATELTNIQTSTLGGKHLNSVLYTASAKGSYQQLLNFLVSLNQEKGIFTQSLQYDVNHYPEATMTVKLKVYDLIS